MEINKIKINNKISILDFFAGAGLVTEALKPWFATVWANDICEKKEAVYTENHGKKYFKNKFIQDVNGLDLPKATISWASFPCQDLSLAGNNKGLNSERSGLVWQWLRVMDEMPCTPPILAIENVAGLISSRGGREYKDLHYAIVKRGYWVGALLINAVHWLPQSRPRVFIIAIKEELASGVGHLITNGPTWAHPASVVKAAEELPSWVWWKIPEPKVKRKRLADIIDFNQPCDDPDTSARNISLIPDYHFQRLKEEIGKIKVAPGYKRIRKGKQVLELRFDEIAGCLRTPNGGSSRQLLVLNGDGTYKTRLLTIREAARLMGVRESYKIPGSYNDGYRAMGDAVAVPAVRFLGRNLLKPLAESINGKHFL